MDEKNLYIVAGCNGAGKTTASFTILPEILNCKEFVNADEIARGLSPFQPDNVAVEAGRIMLNRINELFENRENFALETTLATRTYKNKILKSKERGYYTTLLFFWLKNPELAKERVRIRVREGGHNIKENIIDRRYLKGICNLFDIYMDIVDQVLIFDNSEGEPILFAEKYYKEDLIIYDSSRFNELKKYYDKRI
ncbi:zeta toxin family protein [Sphingobacterium sp. SRCM116780]|uniref:zeta toxin family protein n=1 Tax=Sphingobacterium sp. SRCM116780 TaxID=2907623 RepID=UPI001F0101A9|nr:zeta toxin family protein [Sphingobacterium sp. SRCM116780]UIR57352.1 zeta toxin family protein [Sphingobacterium sp. SRCM116780]